MLSREWCPIELQAILETNTPRISLNHLTTGQKVNLQLK